MAMNVMINLQAMKLPRGIKFNPKDDDAIFFLNEHVSGRPLAPMPFGGGGRIILELDPYDPEQLPDIFRATDNLGSLFFFTKLRRKSRTTGGGTNINRKAGKKSTAAGTNINRKVGEKGNWHGETKNNMIKDERKPVIGISRKLSYWETGSRHHKRYIMTEYLLPNNGTYDMFKDWILCRLVKSNRQKDGYESAANSPCEDGDDQEFMDSPQQAYDDELRNNPTAANSEVEDGDDQELMDSLALAFEFANSEVKEGDDQELMDPPLLQAYDELRDNPTAANSGNSPMAAHHLDTCVVNATHINNLPLEHSTAVEIQPLQTLKAEATWINNLPPEYYSSAVEIPPLQTLVAVDQHGYNDQAMTYENVNPLAALACNSYPPELEAIPPINNLPLEYSTAVEIPPRQTLEVEATWINNLPPEYYSSALESPSLQTLEAEATWIDNLPPEYYSSAVESPSCQTLVAVDQHGYNNQAMTCENVNPFAALACNSYPPELEAIPPINNLPRIVEDGNDKYLEDPMAMGYDNYDNQLRTSEAMNAEQQYWTMYSNMVAMIENRSAGQHQSLSLVKNSTGPGSFHSQFPLS